MSGFPCHSHSQRQHAGSEQLRSNTPVHGWRFSVFSSIDLSFRLAIAPALADGVAHRLDTVTQVLSQAPCAVQPAAACVMQLKIPRPARAWRREWLDSG